jgi:uncharacterized membrane protein YfcA
MKSKLIWYIATGAIAGLLAGFLGIGGGILLVPMMVGLLGLTQHKAHGTSLAIIIPIAIISAIVYALRHQVDWILVAAIGSASVIGVIIGAKLMMKVPAHRLRQLFGIYTIAIATLLLLR